MFSEAEAKRMMAESKSKLQQAREEVERYKARKVRLEQQMEDVAVNVKRAEETVREAQQIIRSVHQVLQGHKATRNFQQEQSKNADEAMLVPEACFPPRPLSPSDEPARDEPRQPSAMNLSFQSEPSDKQPPLQLISTPALMASAPEPESEPPAKPQTQTQTQTQAQPMPKPKAKLPATSTQVTPAWYNDDSDSDQDNPSPPAKRSCTAATSRSCTAATSSSDDANPDTHFDVSDDSTYSDDDHSDSVSDQDKPPPPANRSLTTATSSSHGANDDTNLFVLLYVHPKKFTGMDPEFKGPALKLIVSNATNDSKGHMRMRDGVTAVWAPGTPYELGDANHKPTSVNNNNAIGNARFMCTKKRLSKGECVPKMTCVDPACKTPLRKFLENGGNVRELLVKL